MCLSQYDEGGGVGVVPLDIASLLNQPESATLDFKATDYDLSDERKKRDFAKDLASLANTPRAATPTSCWA